MIGFSTLDETRALGAPIVRLFNIALGHDPDPASLDVYADGLRAGASLVSLAEQLVRTDEFRQIHGSGEHADTAFIARLARHVPNLDIQAACPALDAPAMSRGALLAALALSPDACRLIPLLPGLAPGAAVGDQTAYALWIAEYDTADPQSLQALPSLDGPLITLAMAAGDSNLDAFEHSLNSLKHQIYPRWEIVLTTRLLSPWPRRRMAAWARSEPRLRLTEMPEGGSTAVLLAHGLSQRRGRWAGTMSPGDTLARTALYEIAMEIAAHPTATLVFTDEDRAVDGVRMQPRLKPAYSPETMQCRDAAGQLALFETGLFDAAGGMHPDTWPLHQWDLARRSADIAGSARIRHVPAILFHRDGEVDRPPPEARRRPPIPKMPLPSVSVIVPTRDRALLSACADGVLARTAYPDLELVIVDNGIVDAGPLRLIEELGADPRVKILQYSGPFNFAAINNRAAKMARGEILILLNDDTEVMEPGWLNRLVALAVLDDVGAVGAKLLYPDRTIQHAGMLLGPGAAATHPGRGAAADDPGYLDQFAFARDVSAVTGACLASRAAVWRSVGGMDETLAVAWNDVDYCLRVRAAGLRVVWTPDAVLLHHESASRGSEARDPGQRARFETEKAAMHARWGRALREDPFLNPNLIADESGRLVLTLPRNQRPWRMAGIVELSNRL